MILLFFLYMSFTIKNHCNILVMPKTKIMAIILWRETVFTLHKNSEATEQLNRMEQKSTLGI